MGPGILWVRRKRRRRSDERKRFGDGIDGTEISAPGIPYCPSGEKIKGVKCGRSGRNFLGRNDRSRAYRSSFEGFIASHVPKIAFTGGAMINPKEISLLIQYLCPALARF